MNDVENTKGIFNIIFEFFNSDFFRILAGLSSIIALLVTIYISTNIRRIKKINFIKVRGPEQFNELSKRISKINDYYSDFYNSLDEIKLEIAKTGVLLDWFKKYSSKELRSEIKASKNLVSEMKNNNEEKVKEIVWDFYLILIKISSILETQFQDRKWA